MKLLSHGMARKALILRIAWGSVGFLLILVSILGFLIYRQIYKTNLVGARGSKQFLYIPTGSDIQDVINILENEQLLLDEKSFRWTAHQMKYDIAVKPGKYQLKLRMNNKELISLLRSGRQVPVNVTFNNIRTVTQLANKIGDQIEAKPQAIINLLSDADYLIQLGFNSDNVLALFIPNTYEFYWNTSADKFIKKMKSEYEKFWSVQKLTQAKTIDLTPIQVAVIASIVQMESNKEDEKPIIAGVYINRLKKEWRLEADPTLIFAIGDYSITRVLNVYKEVESPYNTYKYKGLPPGPICLPTIASINSVLNYVHHQYMYFCAKEDFSGYHSFAVSYEQHLQNARRFQHALDKRGI